MPKKSLKIIKIGGNIINDDVLLHNFIKDFAQIDGAKILVHGGGKRATEISESMGVDAKMIEGRRVTDESTLEIVTMVYAGLLNKKIVAQLQELNCLALGLSGADVNSIQAHKRIVETIDYGFVGDIDAVNSEAINVFLAHEMTPVFCAISHDKKGQLLNTNADTIAAEVAIAMSGIYEVELNFVFELKGVLSSFTDKNSVIPFINFEQYEQLMQDGVIADGMLPKMHNCFNALKRGVSSVKIGDQSMIANGTMGTKLRLI